ncbi:hypothetical protein [Nostoc sphaeroides]|nr:hypothetical protein [Nostoc sphaeroides]
MIVGKPSSELLRLLTDDSVESRIELYTRLLYSSQCAAFVQDALLSGSTKISKANAAFLCTVRFDLLEVEQQARCRNLNRQLSRSCPSLFSVLPKEKLFNFVEEFCNSPDFWVLWGRTLAENFCLHVHYWLSAQELGFFAQLARLEGIISGLSSFPDKPSPWPLATSTVPDEVMFRNAKAVEVFTSEWRLIDMDGRLPHPDNLSQLLIPSTHKIIIAILPDCSITVATMKVN